MIDAHGKMWRKQNTKCVFLCSLLLVVLLIVFLQTRRNTSTEDLDPDLSDVRDSSAPMAFTKPAGDLCVLQKDCPHDHFSFFIQSGAANVVAPKICLQNKLVLGVLLNNAGFGINVVIMNGKTGEVLQTGNFDMYNGDVTPLISLLQNMEKGSVVLMASYDEPSTKLNEEARKLIAELGSSSIQSLGYRDNWVFVGGKGASEKSGFEKHVKNDNANNKYDGWPELLELQGCIPKYLE